MPPPPVVSNRDIPRPVQPVSEINIPVSFELKKYFSQAEQQVANEYKGQDSPCEGLRYDYLFQREPFSIRGFGTRIDLEIQGKYKIALDYCAQCAFGRCIVPTLSGSCGYGEPLRKINIAYSSTFTIQPDYRLKSFTTLKTLEPVDRCKMTFLNIDATERLIGYVRGELVKLGTEVDKQIARLDLKPYVSEMWGELNREVRLGSYGFLSINPGSIALSSLNINGSTANFDLTLMASPVLRTTSSPSTPVPLPNLSPYIPGHGFHLCLDLLVSYDTLSRYLSESVKGTVIPIKRKKFIVQSVEVYGAGNQKIVIGVGFGGSRRGKLYLLGTPVYNSLTGLLTFPDLEFDVQSKSVLYKMARWLFNDKITRMMKEGAVYDFKPMLEENRLALQRELTHDFGSGINSSGKVKDLSLQAVYPARDQVILRVMSEGDLSVVVGE